MNETPKTEFEAKGLFLLVAIYNFTSEEILGRLFDGQPHSRAKLTYFFRRLAAFIKETNLNHTGTLAEIKRLGELGFKFDAAGRAVQLINKQHDNNYTYTNTSFEYDEYGRLVNVSMTTGSSFSSIIHISYANNSVEPEKFSMSFEDIRYQDTLGEELTFEMPAQDENILLTFFANPLSEEEIMYKMKTLETTQVNQLTATVKEFREGILFDSWEQAREALIMYGEGNLKRRSEESNFQAEDAAYRQATGISALSLFDARDTQSVTEFVDEHLGSCERMAPGHRGTFSFDYIHMQRGMNNFFKTNLEVACVSNGRYILHIWSGSNVGSVEKQMAESLLYIRVLRNSTVSFNFPSEDNVFVVSGLEKIEEALNTLGFSCNQPLSNLVRWENINLDTVYDEETESLTHQYVYGSSTHRSIKLTTNLPVDIEISLAMPRNTRTGYKLDREDNKVNISKYDEWAFDNDKVLLRVDRQRLDSKKNHPSLVIQISANEQKCLESKVDPYSQELEHIIFSLRERITSLFA